MSYVMSIMRLWLNTQVAAGWFSILSTTFIPLETAIFIHQSSLHVARTSLPVLSFGSSLTYVYVKSLIISILIDSPLTYFKTFQSSQN